MPDGNYVVTLRAILVPESAPAIGVCSRNQSHQNDENPSPKPRLRILWTEESIKATQR